jgi:ABC-type transporter Mla subunit MlaD
MMERVSSRTRFLLGTTAVLVLLAVGYIFVWGASGSGSGGTTTQPLSSTP